MKTVSHPLQSDPQIGLSTMTVPRSVSAASANVGGSAGMIAGRFVSGLKQRRSWFQRSIALVKDKAQTVLPTPIANAVTAALDGAAGLSRPNRWFAGGRSREYEDQRALISPSSTVLSHFGLREHPFEMEPVSERHYPTLHTTRLLGLMEQALMNNGGLIKLVGPAGSGKTLLRHALVAHLAQRPDHLVIGQVVAQHGQSAALIEAVCRAFGLELATSTKKPLDLLGDYLLANQRTGRQSILIIDDAQLLGISGVETAHLLAEMENENGRLLRVLIVGQSPIDAMLASKAMTRIRRAIAFSFNTTPFTVEETQDYILNRLKAAREDGRNEEIFTKAALNMIPEITQGVPGLVNELCTKSLATAHGQQAFSVDVAQVLTSTHEVPQLAGYQPPKKTQQSALTWASAAVGAFSGAAIAASLLLTTSIGERLHDVLTPQSVAALAPRPLQLQDVQSPVAVPSRPLSGRDASFAPPPLPSPTTGNEEVTPSPQIAQGEAAESSSLPTTAAMPVPETKPTEPPLLGAVPALQPPTVPNGAMAPVVAMLPYRGPAVELVLLSKPLVNSRREVISPQPVPENERTVHEIPEPTLAPESSGKAGVLSMAIVQERKPHAIQASLDGPPLSAKAIEPPLGTSAVPSAPVSSVAKDYFNDRPTSSSPPANASRRRGHMNDDGQWVWE